MKIYTRGGDQGETSLFSGERVGKDDLRVEAYGTLDELNSMLGVASATCRDPQILELLHTLQDQLFVAGADLATLSTGRHQPKRIDENHWRGQERYIDDVEGRLPTLKHFVLPGGSAGSSFLQLARSICRRAERLMVKLDREEGEVNPDLLIYVNRLSDLLFVMARLENFSQGVPEVIWRGRE